jgi:hypothetical protein
MGADFPMILHESALFSSGCKLISLRVAPCQVTAKASAPWCVPWFVAPQGISRGTGDAKAIDSCAFSWDAPRKPACNVVETAQRKSQFSYLPVSALPVVPYVGEHSRLLVLVVCSYKLLPYGKNWFPQQKLCLAFLK